METIRAVIIGGSMAGLCAGRALSEFFDRVTVIERDRYPAGIADRAGVPQGRHFHSLLTRGISELERLFPGFRQTCLERGATLIEPALETVSLSPTGWAGYYRTGLLNLAASRALTESAVRDHFRRLSNAEVLENTSVTGLEISARRPRRCTGVRARPRDGGGETTIDADLVVDASGSGSKILQWLRDAEIEPPKETIVDPHGGYASRFYRAPIAKWPSDWWWKGIQVPRTYSREHLDATSVYLGKLEGELWHLSIQALGQRPPRDEEEFNAHIANLRTPLVHEMVQVMEPVSPVYGAGSLHNHRRHYERWNDSLGGFVALGDSVCRLNPLAAQGMTVAAVSATILRDLLDRLGPANPQLPRQFFAAQARFQKDPFRIAAGADFRFPFTDGARTMSLRLFNRYMDAVSLAVANPTVRQRLSEVMRLVKPISALLEPPVISRAAWAGVRLVARRAVGKVSGNGRVAESTAPAAPAAQSGGLPPRPLSTSIAAERT